METAMSYCSLFSPLIYSSLLAVMVFIAGWYCKMRECTDQITDLNAYNRVYHDDTVPYILTFIPFVFVAIYAFIAERMYGWFYCIEIICYYWVGTGFGTGIVNIMKKQLCMPRPYAMYRPDDQESYMSTPSGHMFQITFGILYMMYVQYVLLHKQIHAFIHLFVNTFWSVIPLIVGSTRIMDNHHWPADVIFGAIIAVYAMIPIFILMYHIVANQHH